ncbi:MAG: phosphate/phosphite/phosphonate ABC transporter substrate-binding protein [Deltaproteobacteria bacterium]|nr:phosphate/phosphite/phosphonate ABC transporter substrate-binding protein [Deltaproteobacteria bacterium]
MRWDLMGFALVLALLTGCGRADPPPGGLPGPEKKLLIGLIPEQNIFKQVERYTPLAEYLSGKLGRQVELKVLTRYGNIVDNFVNLRMDGAFFGSFSYALAQRKLGLRVLARPEWLDGSSSYHGLIFTRRDSGIRTVRDMRDKRFALVDQATTAGYLLPLVYFRQKGILNHKLYLKEVYFAGTHEDAILDVLNRKADIGAAKNTVLERMARTDPRIGQELRILERSPDVPENALAARQDLAGGLQDRLRSLLLAMDEEEAGRTVLQGFGARRFIPTTDREYEPVFAYAREIRLDLSRYEYRNE